MKKNIHAEEDLIFEAYQVRLKQKGSDLKVSADGLHFGGRFVYSLGTWGREGGDEELQWAEACRQKRGLVVLTKELNDNEAWDIRKEHGRKNECEVPTPSTAIFYRRLRMWVYGLITMDEKGMMPPCPDALVAQKHFEEAAWVRVNLKKVPGKGRISKSELRKYVTNFRDLLLEQLALYAGASIYIDCAHHEGRVLLCELYPDLQAFGTDDDPWIYYSESKKLIVINSYHPSSTRITKDYYDNMREAVADFFKAHPHFYE